MSTLSFQLYSARNFPPLEETFALLARVGYRNVEGFGGLFADPQALRAQLDRHGLAMPTSHFGLDQLRDRRWTLNVARTVGISKLYCPAIPREQWEQPEEDWVSLAAELAELDKFYKGEGFGFGWHNHHFEFWPTASGRLPMDILLEGAPELDWQMDVAWIVRADHDPVKWLEAHGRRINAIHIKDIAPVGEALDEDGWADVGHGTMDWAALHDAIVANTKAEYLVMEHDNPKDVERFATRSFASVSKIQDTRK